MSRNKIYTIVEGHGEANRPLEGERPAIIVLVRRLLRGLQCGTLFPNEKDPPFRISYSEFFRNDKFERAIRYHKQYQDCAAVLVVLDMDDACPKEKAHALTKRVAIMEQLPFSVVVVCARREFESWFLASLETIHPGTIYEQDPEEIRDAKGWLRKKFGYKPTQHQASYTQKLDLNLAFRRSRSFRRLYHAIEEIIHAEKESRLVITPVELSRKNANETEIKQ